MNNVYTLSLIHIYLDDGDIFPLPEKSVGGVHSHQTRTYDQNIFRRVCLTADCLGIAQMAEAENIAGIPKLPYRRD